MSLLERLHERRHLFTKQEQVVASYLEAGYPHAGLESATAISKRTGISAATIVRFIAKLGFNGYADFQKHLRDAVEVRLAPRFQRLDERVDVASQDVRSGDVVERTFETAITSVTQTYALLDRERIYAVAKLLLSCRGRILIAGAKRSQSLVLYCYSMLTSYLERVAILPADESFLADQVMDIGPDDILIAIDPRRYIGSTLRVAKWAQKRGAALVVLTDSSKAPSSPLTVYTLVAEASNSGVFDTYVGLMLTIDVLINVIASSDPARVRERLALGETAWKEFDIFSHDRVNNARPTKTGARNSRG